MLKIYALRIIKTLLNQLAIIILRIQQGIEMRFIFLPRKRIERIKRIFKNGFFVAMICSIRLIRLLGLKMGLNSFSF